MAGSDRHCLTVRGLDGVHFGYGRMFISLRDAVSELVDVVDNAATVVDVLLPNMVKGWWDGQRRVCFTMWETDQLPPEFFEHLKQFDLILVPCNQNKELFSKHHPDVKVVPLGTNTDFWCPTVRPENKTIRFLAGGSHWQRKGLDAVVQAWEELEPEGCELVIKCQTKNFIGEIPVFKSSSIKLVDATLTAEEERDLYWSADCFIAASRGEGWGLMPLQAICAGIPTLMTNTTGHQEFSHLASRLITTTPAPASDPRFYNIGNWDDPDVESIKSSIQWFIKNRKTAKTKALANSKKARAYTWGASAQALLEAVQPSCETVSTKKWVQSTGDYVDIIALRRIQADIGIHHVDLRKGETAKVPVNVRDVLANAGLI